MAQSQTVIHSANSSAFSKFAMQAPASPRRYSTELRAVLRIIEADEFLRCWVLPFIDCDNESIDWDGIFAMPLGSGHRAALVMAFGIWTDRLREGSNPFEMAFSLGHDLQRAVLAALAIRWGVFSDPHVNPLR